MNMDTVYVFYVALATALIVMGLIVRPGKSKEVRPVETLTVKDLAAWERNVNTDWR